MPYGIWDADHHFPEAEDAIARYIEPEFRDRVVVDVIRRERDRLRALANDAPHNEMAELAARAVSDTDVVPGLGLGRLNPYANSNPSERAEMLAEFVDIGARLADPVERLKVLDAQGVEAALTFPQREGLLVHDCFPNDPPATFANVRAFNRYVEEEWGHAYEQRVFIPAAMSFLDVDLAIAELERVLAAGARTILLPPGPANRQSPADPKFDPFWARVNEAGIGVAVHLNYTEYQHESVWWGEDPAAHFPKEPSFTAFQWFAYWGDRPVMDLAAALIFHNLFTRFPQVRVCCSEQGAVWVPYLLRKLDHAYGLGLRVTHGPMLTERPSDTFRRHFLVAPFPEEHLGRPLEALGVDQIVFGSDFPHPEGLDDPSRFVTQSFVRELSVDDQRKLMRENLRGFLLGAH